VPKSGKAKTKQASKSKPVPPAEAKGTPVCIAALYCNTAVIGEDKTVTIVQTLDTITFGPDLEFKLGEAVEIGGLTRLVVMLKRDNATGRHELPLVFTSPSGETDVIGIIVQDFSENAGPEVGYNLVIPIRIVWRGEGLYWLQIKSTTNKVIARTPLRLKTTPKRVAK
jgi:hypothetical protein